MTRDCIITRREPLDPEFLHGLAREFIDSENDSPEVREAVERATREILGGETESEFSSLMNLLATWQAKLSTQSPDSAR